MTPALPAKYTAPLPDTMVSGRGAERSVLCRDRFWK